MALDGFVGIPGLGDLPDLKGLSGLKRFTDGARVLWGRLGSVQRAGLILVTLTSIGGLSWLALTHRAATTDRIEIARDSIDGRELVDRLLVDLRAAAVPVDTHGSPGRAHRHRSAFKC